MSTGRSGLSWDQQLGRHSPKLISSRNSTGFTADPKSLRAGSSRVHPTLSPSSRSLYHLSSTRDVNRCSPTTLPPVPSPSGSSTPTPRSPRPREMAIRLAHLIQWPCRLCTFSPLKAIMATFDPKLCMHAKEACLPERGPFTELENRQQSSARIRSPS